MAGTVEQKLAAQGIVLTEPRTPMANYVGFVRTGNLLFVSGQVCANASAVVLRESGGPSTPRLLGRLLPPLEYWVTRLRG